MRASGWTAECVSVSVIGRNTSIRFCLFPVDGCFQPGCSFIRQLTPPRHVSNTCKPLKVLGKNLNGRLAYQTTVTVAGRLTPRLRKVRRITITVWRLCTDNRVRGTCSYRPSQTVLTELGLAPGAEPGPVSTGAILRIPIIV